MSVPERTNFGITIQCFEYQLNDCSSSKHKMQSCSKSKGQKTHLRSWDRRYFLKIQLTIFQINFVFSAANVHPYLCEAFVTWKGKIFNVCTLCFPVITKAPCYSTTRHDVIDSSLSINKMLHCIIIKFR